MWTRVIRDTVQGWRVVCPVHGQLAAYLNFWVASRDARQHDENCPDSETAAPNP